MVTRAVADQAELEPRWVALGDDFVLPGSFKKASDAKKTKRSIVEDSEELRKRAAVERALAIMAAQDAEVAEGDEEAAHLERRQQVCSVVTVTKGGRPITATRTTSTAAATSTRALACRLTSECVGQPVPDNANPYCLQSSGKCSFRESRSVFPLQMPSIDPPLALAGCYKNYELVDGACVQAGAATTR